MGIHWEKYLWLVLCCITVSAYAHCELLQFLHWADGHGHWFRDCQREEEGAEGMEGNKRKLEPSAWQRKQQEYRRTVS